MILLILPIFLLSKNIVYSLQIATFTEYNKADKYKKQFSNRLTGLFLYKTDSGYWTVRYGKEKSRKDILSVKKILKDKILQKAIPVPTSLSKLDIGIQKNTVVNIVKIPKVFTQKNNFFSTKIISLKNEYRKIDTYTFNLKVEARIYVVQFSEFPYSKRADKIFDSKPKSSNINSVILSNEMVIFSIKLNDIETSSAEIEKVLLPILNRGRRNSNIRVKAYRLKNSFN